MTTHTPRRHPASGLLPSPRRGAPRRCAAAWFASAACAVGLGGALAASVTTGCSSSSGGLSGDQACADRANASCSRLTSCAPGRFQAIYGDQATCVSLSAALCESTLAAPSTGQTAQDVEACAQATPSWSCPDFLDSANPPAACAQRKGSIVNGGACVFPAQCASGFCALVPDIACGACAATPVVGQSCAALDSCGAGLTCTTDTQTCVAFAGSGQPCGVGAPCGAGLSCVGFDATTNQMGVCAAAVTTQGAACDPTLRTGPGCDPGAGLACDASSSTCAPIALAATGAPCGEVNGQTTACANAAICDIPDGGAAGKCLAAAPEGARCDETVGPGCQPLSRCVISTAVDAGAGTCIAPSAASCM